MKWLDWWRVAKIGGLLMCFGLATSVQSEVPSTHVDTFSLSWSQMVGILGFVGAVFGGAAELRRWMMDLDKRVQRIEEHCDSQNGGKE